MPPTPCGARRRLQDLGDLLRRVAAFDHSHLQASLGLANPNSPPLNHPHYRDDDESRSEKKKQGRAFAAFEEESKGSLEVGKLADITVLSRDIMTVPEEEIRKTEVLYTIVGGAVRYRRAAD